MKFVINTVKSALLGVIMLTMFSSTRSNYMQISNTNLNLTLDLNAMALKVQEDI